MPQLDPVPDRDLDRVLEESAAATPVPGVQAALLRRGRLVWSGTYGAARDGTPVDARTVFCLASLGKTLVAALALRLVEQGRLHLDRPIADIVPEVPGADVVTPRMLLGHTAGYPEIYVTPALAPLFPRDAAEEPEEAGDGAGAAYDPDRPFTWAMLLPGFADPVRPGTHWEYSNGGYILLTELLVRLHGGPDGLAAAWRELAARAGAPADDLVLDRAQVDLARMARGHTDAGGEIVDAYAAHPPHGIPTDLFGLPFGDGLFAGTATAVATFLDGLFVQQTVLEPATLGLMTTTTAQAAAAAHEVPDPVLATYGLGTLRIEAEGGSWQGHRGSYGGFLVLGASERTRGLSLAVLTNLACADPPALAIWRALAAEALRVAEG
jgi:CubicO group peptidase (beta-lactamase class C family)